MLPYWILYGSASLAAFFSGRSSDRKAADPIGLAIIMLVATMIGMRYRVGADWESYLSIYQIAGHFSFLKAVANSDPAFQALNWLGMQVGADIWFVNLGCGAIFSWGLYRFSRHFENPGLVVAIAIPYLAIVVAMGYTRQGAALGFVMAGLASFLERENILRFTIYVFLGALFHSSAVVVLPLVALSGKRSRLTNFLVSVVAAYIGYSVFADAGLEKIRNVYLNAKYASQGALIRIGMDVSAAILFMILHRSLNASRVELTVWRNFSVAAVIALASLAVASSSAVVDRLALYLLPLQLAVFARAAAIGGRNNGVVFAILVLFGLVLFVWLNFAANAATWLPYDNYLFPGAHR